jgi:hypothetical protein
MGCDTEMVEDGRSCSKQSYWITVVPDFDLTYEERLF